MMDDATHPALPDRWTSLVRSWLSDAEARAEEPAAREGEGVPVADAVEELIEKATSEVERHAGAAGRVRARFASVHADAAAVRPASPPAVARRLSPGETPDAGRAGLDVRL